MLPHSTHNLSLVPRSQGTRLITPCFQASLIGNIKMYTHTFNMETANNVYLQPYSLREWLQKGQYKASKLFDLPKYTLMYCIVLYKKVVRISLFPRLHTLEPWKLKLCGSLLFFSKQSDQWPSLMNQQLLVQFLPHTQTIGGFFSGYYHLASDHYKFIFPFSIRLSP